MVISRLIRYNIFKLYIITAISYYNKINIHYTNTCMYMYDVPIYFYLLIDLFIYTTTSYMRLK